MASGRFLSTSIAEDDRLSRLSMEGELLFLKTIPHLDRDGMISGKPGFLWGKVCPLREDLIGQMQTAIDEWIRVGLVVRMMTDAGPVLFFPGFLKNNSLPHYNRERASRFPVPPGYIRTDKGLTLVAVQAQEHEYVQELVHDEVQESIQDFDLQEQEQEQEQDKEEVKDQDQPNLTEKEETQAHDPLSVAWQQAYEGIEMPPKLAKSLVELVTECGMAAAVHGIKASAAKKDGRNFRYIAECARNYVPPASYAHVNGTGSYRVDLPSVPKLQPVERSGAPPPMPHDDPWAIALAELLPTLPGQAGLWLEHSELSIGEIAGEPLYEILVRHPQANVEWLQRQTERAIRQKLGTIIGKRVNVGFVLVDAVTP